MNILLVSECTKNALKETRRVLDQFAERTGRRTWQTAITEEGLKTLHRLLRKTARRNTAVACFWTRGRNRTELLWVVGDRGQFNARGRVPTKRTRSDILRKGDEHTWAYGKSIQIVATLAALLHDLGKATLGFQNKLELTLKNRRSEADPYRHEWLSLQLFVMMVSDCNTNEEVLERLEHFRDYQTKNPNWYQPLHAQKRDQIPLGKRPALVQLLGWLIVTHHRMPFLEENFYKTAVLKAKQNDNKILLKLNHRRYFTHFIKALDGWTQQSWTGYSEAQKEQFWALKEPITESDAWLNELARWAKKGQRDLSLPEGFITNPLIYYLARVTLMVGDHNYSSLTVEESDKVVKQKQSSLLANTDRDFKTGKVTPKQTLDQHLIGVSRYAAKFGYLLPHLKDQLPALPNHRPFVKRTTIERFKWQDNAYDLAESLNEKSHTQGFFGVNMASTGCGKTTCNARIMYALRDQKLGARFTIALGLRVLTLQTGQALRKQLNLDDEALAVLVGGGAQKSLFELNNEEKENGQESFNLGSESVDRLIEGAIDIGESSAQIEAFQTLFSDQKGRQLMTAPLVSCTIDHLINASESLRGGSHIVPILRLFTADLILDEPDDFGIEDLPALARLVYLTGLLGSRVLLSSATLTPDLIGGLFEAYQAGYSLWRASHVEDENDQPLPIVCAWFDEFNAESAEIKDSDYFDMIHNQFVAKRVSALHEKTAKGIKHQAHILPLPEPFIPDNRFHDIARQILEEAGRLHDHHHTAFDDKRISMGLIRIANIKTIVELAQALYATDINLPDTEIHLALYHSRQVMLVRNQLETVLDRVLERKNPATLINHPEISERIGKTSASNHLFIVLGSPVTEVGRDHDYDWAIVEPSSMRSIIQLAGRVWRHRDRTTSDYPNIALLGAPFRAMKSRDFALDKPVFHYPGFESEEALLHAHKTAEVISPEALQSIDSIPRIMRQKGEMIDGRYATLSDLEHGVMQSLLNPKSPNYVNAFWDETLAHHLTVHQRLISPFRRSRKESLFFVEPDLESPQALPYTIREVESARENLFSTQGSANERIMIEFPNFAKNPQIKPWLTFDLNELLVKLSDRLGEENITYLAYKYAQISLEMTTYGGEAREWKYYPTVGFW